MWYTVEDNPEITAALEEERASSLSRKNSPRAKRGEALLTTEDDTAARAQLPLTRRAKLAANRRLCSPVEVVVTGRAS